MINGISGLKFSKSEKSYLRSGVDKLLTVDDLTGKYPGKAVYSEAEGPFKELNIGCAVSVNMPPSAKVQEDAVGCVIVSTICAFCNEGINLTLDPNLKSEY